MEVSFIPPQLDCPRGGVIAEVKPFQVDDVILVLEDQPTEEVGMNLVGSSILIRTEDLPEDALLAHDGMMDWDVVDVALGSLGSVTDIIDGPAQQLLEVTDESGREVLIPYVDAFIVDVDYAAKTLTVKIPAGLLTLGD